MPSVAESSKANGSAATWAHESLEWLSESTKVITNYSQRLSVRKGFSADTEHVLICVIKVKYCWND